MLGALYALGYYNDCGSGAEPGHWSECGRATSLVNSSALDRPHRSVLSFEMNQSPRVRVFTEVHKGNEEWAGDTSFPSLPSVTRRGIAGFCRSGALGPRPGISNQPLEPMTRSAVLLLFQVERFRRASRHGSACRSTTKARAFVEQAAVLRCQCPSYEANSRSHRSGHANHPRKILR